MVDSPPENTGAQAPPDWRKIIGDQAAQSATMDTPHVAGGVSFANVDSPPAGSHPDVLKQFVADKEANRELRDKYSDRAYHLAFSCLWGWGAMLIASGFVNGIRGEPLWSDKVIIAVTTGVTVSVLAAFLGVIRGLFGVSDSNGKDKK